jgi:SET domain-containing protein
VRRDHLDFYTALDEYGFTPKEVQLMSEASNRIQLPPGEYKFRVDASDIEGWGIFAIREIPPGEIIAPARINGLRTVVGRFTNHSATPNAQVLIQLNDNINLVAARPIHWGEEVTIDYRQAMKINGLEPKK